MPIATLLYPRTLTTKGKTFEQGKPEPVSDEVGLALRDNPRFDVTGLPGDKIADTAYFATVREGGGRPHVKATRLAMIREATGVLDVEDEAAFEDNGLPNIEALAKVMGWTPTEGDIREALRPGADRAGDDGVAIQAGPPASRVESARLLAERLKERRRAKPPSPELTVAMSDTTARVIETPVEAPVETDPPTEAELHARATQDEQDEVEVEEDAPEGETTATEPKPNKRRLIRVRRDPTTEGAITVPLASKGG